MKRWLAQALFFCLPIVAFGAESPEAVRRKAERGDAEAQFNLGVLYRNERGDSAEGAKWHRKAAEQGFALAQLHLGVMYVEGDGVPKDEIEAYAYFNLAAVSLSAAKSFREILEKQFSRNEILAGQRRTKELQMELEAKRKSAGK